ncbi:type I secretion system permease/ATPase [Acinetobacter junii]|uniref:type I secretion system permease/ATPase n=1 Tax=Acinetobacter junii TaxID=40215 RepID=UPI000F6612AE|nr:type I secretion system permease/ATPase [Acinetobacter junii]MBL8281541.1 type I secretion system permease/ATPase [Acinetobacter junii]MDH1004481.1 type I secretion system permease/ATPase [Acinetobacter junii]QXR28650.1 type I secretion system permease/ATPase [Acinetobacter junii]
MTTQIFDPLALCLIRVAKDYEISITQEGLLSGLPLPNGKLIPQFFSRAADRVSLTSNMVQQNLDQLNHFVFPAILILNNNTACVLYRFDTERQTATVYFPEMSDTVTEVPIAQLQEKYLGSVIYLQQRQFVADNKVKLEKTNQHWFWSVIRQHRSMYKDILLAALFVNIFALCAPFFVMNVYDRVVPNHATDTLWVLAFGIMIIITADFILKLVRSYFVDLAATRADNKLSAYIMEKVLGRRMEQNNMSVGMMASNIQSYEAIRYFTSSMTVVSLIDLPFFVLFLAVICIISWVFVIPLVIAAIIILLYALSVHISLKKLSDAMAEASQQRQGLLIETLNNQETIKSFNAAGRMQTLWEKATRFTVQYSSKLRFIGGTVGNFAGWVQQTAGVVIILVGVYLIVDGKLTQGALIACYLLSTRALAPIAQIAGLLTQYYQASSALNMLNQTVDAEQERENLKGWVSHPHLIGHIEFKNVSLCYPNESHSALNNISFSIRAGEKVAILGKVGSGKSSIEKILLSLYKPTEGSVFIDQTNISQIDPAELRSQIGYIPQDIQLLNGTVLSNIVLGNPHASRVALEQSLVVSGLSQILKAHEDGLSLQVGEGGHKLSGGQRQAVAVARAIAQNAKILVFDEPTSAMDTPLENHVIHHLKHYMTAQHTLILVTHKPALLTLVDRIIILEDGKIIADGDKESVMKAMFPQQAKVAGAVS